MAKTSSGGNTARRVEEPTPRRDTCPSYCGGSFPDAASVDRLRELTKPHVESFDFFLEKGLALGIQALEPSEFALVDPGTERAKRYKALRAAEAGLEMPPPSLDEYNDTTHVRFWMENISIDTPTEGGSATNKPLYPRVCRESKRMYAGTIRGVFCYQIIQRRNGMEFPGRPVRLPKEFGSLPIMVCSRACHLRNTTPKQLVNLGEEDNEAGGYFIVNGIERCMRMLQVPRRNYPAAVKRATFSNKGPTYTDLGISMRCARPDQSTITNTLHYLTTGGATLRFLRRKQEFLIPVVIVLRAMSCPNPPKQPVGGMLKPTIAHSDGERQSAAGSTDEELYQRLVQGDEGNTFLVARANLLLQDARARYPELNTPNECLAYMGARFRYGTFRAETTTDIQAGHYMLRQFMLVHLPNYADKLSCLLFMLRKLYALAAGDCGVENSDSLQQHELLLPGHFFCGYIKEKFEEGMQQIRLSWTVELRKNFEAASRKVHIADAWSKMVDRHMGKTTSSIGKKAAVFLATGNLISTTNLDLMQTAGYTIVAERLNFLRFCAHFRAVHRGSFFLEMRTTAVRKLLPDQWGFLCPVHTPDGGPCGLLSHMSIQAQVMAYPAETKNKRESLQSVLYSIGVAPCLQGRYPHTHLPVLLDGCLVGSASPKDCQRIASCLRSFKVALPESQRRVPDTLEVTLIPSTGNQGAPYPGMFLATQAARMVRPVLQLATNRVEYIGPLEQGFMEIAVLEEDLKDSSAMTHRELDPTNMLSLIANLTPFSDQNQSPRNMYQCQMGKQTMGTPAHSLPHRSDNKLYRLHTPQAPIVQTTTHSKYKMDEYPNGTNAVIAVMSYTGFDMEDAMILNKSSLERGFKNASVYKTVSVSMESISKGLSRDAKLQFSNRGVTSQRINMAEHLDEDGFPPVGDVVQYGSPLYCVVDQATGKVEATEKHKDRETAVVQCVRQFGRDNNSSGSITLRYPRKPVIGDKFSSRHGQKGVLSIVWPQEDLPFTESGLIPDILFNPHGFPSRMTIGMLVEMMAAKSGALHGFFQNGTPFTFHETANPEGQVSVDYFGEQLQAAGYNYYGSEPLYSGVSGCVLKADLYIGVVYYQRLRHMVSDKYQVRATGPVNPLTRQPIKGRKQGGGIRLGEMERDSLLSHGAAFLLHDRLLNCSDRHVGYACTRCGDMLLPTTERCTLLTTGQSSSEAINKPRLRLFCRNPQCSQRNKNGEEGGDDEDDTTRQGNDEAVEPIIMPYVYRYLVNELAAMNISLKLDIR